MLKDSKVEKLEQRSIDSKRTEIHERKEGEMSTGEVERESPIDQLEKNRGEII